MQLPTSVDDLTSEQLIKLALDTRDSTIQSLSNSAPVLQAVDDRRKILIREKARSKLYAAIDDLGEAALQSEDVGKKAQAVKLLHTIAGYDEEVTAKNDRAVLIIKIGDTTTTVTAEPLETGEDVIDGELVEDVQEAPLVILPMPVPTEPKPPMPDEAIDAAFAELLDE